MSITFQYPYAAPILTLVLRNPELGDSNGYNTKAQFKIAMDGTIQSHKRTPISERLLMTFRNLTDPKIFELRDFFEEAAGYELKYTDYNAIVWRGYLATQPIEMTTERTVHDGTCIEDYTVVIEFKGTPI